MRRPAFQFITRDSSPSLLDPMVTFEYDPCSAKSHLCIGEADSARWKSCRIIAFPRSIRGSPSKEDCKRQAFRVHILTMETTLTEGSFRFTEGLREKRERKSSPAHPRNIGAPPCYNGRWHRDLFQVFVGTGGCVCNLLSARSRACLSVVLRTTSQRSVSNGRGSCCEDERCWKGLRQFITVHFVLVSRAVAISSLVPVGFTDRTYENGTEDRLEIPQDAVKSAEPGEDIMDDVCFAICLKLIQEVSWMHGTPASIPNSASWKDPTGSVGRLHGEKVRCSRPICIAQIGTGASRIFAIVVLWHLNKFSRFSRWPSVKWIDSCHADKAG